MLNEARCELAVTPVRRQWEPEDLFAGLVPGDSRFRQAERDATWAKLWKDLYTEYDARHLEQEICSRGLIVSPEGEAFMSAWSGDERRHTRGFVRIMELVVEAEGDDIWARLADRQHDFAKIDPFLADEFSVLVMIAFDEMVTCHAYAQDLGFYSGLGDSAFREWLRELMADEAAHCHNAVRVIRSLYGDRTEQVAPMLTGLVEGVEDPTGYCGTFVFDHFGEHYTPSMLKDCHDAVLKAIVRPSH
jgi:hypothetical protein